MENKSGVRVFVAVFSVIVLIAVCIMLLSNPVTAGIMLGRIYSLLTDKIGWLFSIFGLACFIFLVWLSVSKYGKIRLGKPGEKPQFSRFSWVAMLFCTGMGSTLVYWSIVEPIQYYAGPPFGLEVGSVSAIEYAAAYGSFHWGLVPWALLTVPVVPIAYYFYVRRKPQLSLSSSLEGQWGGRIGKKACAVIDILVIFATVANCCTCLGVETPTISSLLNMNYGTPDTLGMQIGIVAIFICIFSLSSFLGLEKGIKKLSSINIYLVLALMIAILFLGPTSFIMNTFTNDLSIMFNDFFRMSLYTDPFGGSGWPQGWTIYYWAWWLCATPFTALFIAQISKGRTIRETALGGVIWGTLGDFIAFGILGGSAIYAQVYDGMDLVSIYETAGGPTVVATLISSLPLGMLLIPLTIVSMIIFSSTTYDSCAFVLSSLTYRGKDVNDESPRWMRLAWSSVVGFAAATLLVVGGLEPLQSFSIITAIPILVICVLVVAFFMKDLIHDYNTVVNRSGDTSILEFGVTPEGELEEAAAVVRS